MGASDLGVEVLWLDGEVIGSEGTSKRTRSWQPATLERAAALFSGRADANASEGKTRHTSKLKLGAFPNRGILFSFREFILRLSEARSAR